MMSSGIGEMLVLAVAFMAGFGGCWGLLFVRKRMVAYNEFVKLKRQLAAFVAVDERIAGLYPPSYLEDAGTLCGAESRPNGASSAGRLWETCSESDGKKIKNSISLRIEAMASETSDPLLATALRYTLEKSGKMVRSRLVVLLANFLQVPEDKKFVRIAEIVELEHCASLLHDDVVDDADTRRGIPSHRKLFGDRTAVLAGDDLISLLVDVLAEVDDMRVTRAIAKSIEGLVVGELLQLVEGGETGTDGAYLETRISNYLRKSYFKTASLFAAIGECVGCCGVSSAVQQHLCRFGYFFGMAFQLVDDLLDFSGSTEIGKPGNGADIRNGTATLPVLFACLETGGLSAPERSELQTMMLRKFNSAGDCERALLLVHKSDGIAKTRKLVREYFGKCRLELSEISKIVYTDDLFRDALFSLLHAFEARTV